MEKGKILEKKQEFALLSLEGQRCVFFGNDSFSVPFLEVLCDLGCEVLVVTNAWKARGRGLRLLPTPVEEFARSRGLPVLYGLRLRAPEFLGCLAGWGADWGLVVAYRILPLEVLRLFGRGLVNVHPSLLPAYRGAAPLHHMVLNDECVGGVSLIQITAEVDAGPVLAQRAFAIGRGATLEEVRRQAIAVGCQLLREVLPLWVSGRVRGVVQCGVVIGAPRLGSADRVVSWRMRAREFVARVRALSPRPGARLQWRPDLWIKVLDARVVVDDVPDQWVVPGTPVLDSRGRLLLRVRDGWVELRQVVPPGKRPMDGGVWLRGCQPHQRRELLNPLP